MASVHLVGMPGADDPADDRVVRDLAEVDAAVGLVASGSAVRVRLVGLTDAHRVVGAAVARGQAAGVLVRLDRTGASPGLIVGPRR